MESSLTQFLLWAGIITVIYLVLKWLTGKKPTAPAHPVPAPDGATPDYESFYNSKYPKADILYDGRKVPWREGRYNIDVRNFFNPYDSTVIKIAKLLNVQAFEDNNDNNLALACFNWVRDHVKYAYDVNPNGSQTDYWNFPFETLLPRSFDDPQLYGDCEDQAILLANLLLASGIPYWKIRLTAGVVSDGTITGGHCFVTYFDEPRARWVLLDTTWYPSTIPIMSRKDYRDEGYVREIWFSWNLKYAFSEADVRMTSELFKPQITQKG